MQHAFGMLVPLLSAAFLAAQSADVRRSSTGGDDAAAARTFAPPLCFERNTGRWHDRVRFVARGGPFDLFLTANSSVLTARGPDGRVGTLRTELVGAAPEPAVIGEARLAGRVHHYRGDPSRWRQDVPLHGRVRYAAIWPGVDLVFHGRGRELEYDFEVAPKGDPAVIALRFEGADELSVDAAGDLVARTHFGEVRHRKPLAYQERDGGRREVPVRFVVDGERVSFALGCFDRARPLVIDPVLVFSSFLGGSGADQAPRLAVDAAGFSYVTGYTSSADFPLGDPLQGFGGGGDVFITKITPDGSAIVYSTYYGGSGGETNGVHGIDVAADGSAAIVGGTQGADFPTLNAFQTGLLGNQSAFLVVLAANGALRYATYYGGSSFDRAGGVAFDGQGLVTIAGETGSADLPVSGGAFQSVRPGGGSDAFFARFDPSRAGANSFLGATYYGGNGFDSASDLTVVASVGLAIVGRTTSTNLPTSKAFQAGFGGGSHDAFVAIVDASFATLTYATYLGGADSELFDNAFHHAGIVGDAQGCVYVTGDTESADFPTTPGAFQTARRGARDAFVTKLDPNAATTLVWSTYLGGSREDGGADIDVDAQGCAIVTGRTTSTDYPLRHPVSAPPTGIGYDVLLTMLTADGSALRFSTTLGAGVQWDRGSGVGLDASGNAFCAGTTGSSWPSTANAFQPNAGGGADCFVARIDLPRAARASYGNGTAGTLGVPALTTAADPVLGTTINLDIGNSLGAPTPAILLVGSQQLVFPFFGGTLLLLPDFSVALNLPAAGLPLPVRVRADACGGRVFLQVLEIDAGAPQGVSFSRGLELALGI